jgi:hypothetical protein
MPRPKGSPKTGGRRPRSRNKLPLIYRNNTLEVRSLAREFTVECINTLVKIMREGAEDAVRLMAAKLLLERGHGLPKIDVHVDQALYFIKDTPLTPEEWAKQYCEPKAIELLPDPERKPN